MDRDVLLRKIMVQSLKIKSTLKLQSIALVFDQTLYAKVTELQWKQSKRFKDIMLRMRVFHKACTLLSIIGKRFQDAGLRDLLVDSGVIAEGSVAGALDGRRYNRGVRLHKIMYEALMRLAWQRFVACIQKNHKESKTTVDGFFSEIDEFCDNICQTQFKKHMTSTSSVDFVKLFDKYLKFLRHENGKLSKFWLSYLDVVEIFLRLRASRECKRDY